MAKKLWFVAFVIVIYWILENYVPYGQFVLYPITLLVTFFHETGHALLALVTGGSVHGIQINNDGSGYALVAGGIPFLVIPGGYIGSALWGNLILAVALYKDKYARWMIYLMMAVLVLCAIVWFNSLGTTILLLVFTALFYALSKSSKSIQVYVLITIGASSLVYILMDFNGGPSSDLNKFSSLLPFLPPFVWALVWLLIVSYITYLNLRKSWR